MLVTAALYQPIVQIRKGMNGVVAQMCCDHRWTFRKDTLDCDDPERQNLELVKLSTYHKPDVAMMH